MKTRASITATSVARIAAGCNGEKSLNLNVPTLLAFWKKNKYPLLALNHGGGSPELLGSPEFQAARNEENIVYNSLKAEYYIVQERWARAGIRSILIKSGGVFPSFPYTSDNLDVLIKEEDEAAARAILLEEGYVELINIEEPKKFLFRKFSEGLSISAIHLHTQVGWLVGFMDEKALWERSRVAPDDASITVPSPEDIILITTAHSFYENKRFRFADVVKIHEWWSQGSINWEYMDRVAIQRGWLDGLHFCLLLYAHIEEAIWGETTVPMAIREAWRDSLKRLPLTYRYFRKAIHRSPLSLPFDVSFFFSKILYYKKIVFDRRRCLTGKLYDVLFTLLVGIKLKARLNLHPSFLVSFSGPDGSGKTVHAQTLEKILIVCGLEPKYYWNRTATSGFIRFFSVIIKAFRKSQTSKEGAQNPGAAGRGERLRNPLLRSLWSYLVAADMVWSYFSQVRLPMLWGKVVICDRYIFDAATEMECSLSPRDKINRLAIKLMLILTPKPAIAYFLDIPDDVCAERKAENTDSDYLRQQREKYSHLIKRYDMRVKNTNGDFSTVADAMAIEALNAYYDNFKSRFMTRLSWLFVFRTN